MARTYRLARRAERQEETRQRIVDAAIELHQTIGPLATSMSDIADRAGVGRVTVYRHFADENELAKACSGHYMATHPLPDLDRWRAIRDPRKRLHTGLTEAYAYHRWTEAMMSHVLADARDHPVMAPYHEYWCRAADVLAAGWGVRGRRKELMRAGIGLAIGFDAWRALVREQGLSDAAAVELMLRLAEPCAT